MNEALNDTIESLIKQIYDCFRNLKYPGDNNLLHEECMDDNDIQDFYGQATWKEVPDKILEDNNASLCFFSPTGYQFFLPAYLQWALRNYPTNSSFSIDSTIYSLNPIDDDTGIVDAFSESKYTKFTKEQKGTVVKFLEFMRDYGEGRVDIEQADKALQEYWYKKHS